MGQHSKYSFEMKLAAVTKYLEGSCSTESIARSLGTNGARIIEWATIYQSLGAEGLKATQKPSAYSAETKRSAVCDYLSGKGTLREIQKKYGIRSDKQLRNWIMKYNGHENLKSSGTGGASIMTKGRKTTYEERVEIVKYCIGHGMGYAQTAEKYQASYQQIYQWIRKYQSNGVEGLVEKRGKRKTESEMSELEKLRAENRLLQAEKRKAELEVAFLKKLGEIERRRFWARHKMKRSIWQCRKYMANRNVLYPNPANLRESHALPIINGLIEGPAQTKNLTRSCAALLKTLMGKRMGFWDTGR